MRGQTFSSKRIIIFFLVLLVFFRPLISGLTYPWFNNLAQVLLLLLFSLWMLEKISVREGGWGKTPFLLPLIAFFCALIISNFRSINHHRSLTETFNWLSYLLFYFLVINNFQEEKSSQWIIRALLLSAALVSIYAIYQYFYGLEATRKWVESHPEFQYQYLPHFKSRLYTNRAFSTFITPNALGGFISLLLPLTIALFLLSPSPGEKTAMGILFLLFLLTLFLSFSKGAWLSFLLSMGIFLFLFAKGKIYRYKNQLLIGALIFFIFVGLGIWFARLHPLDIPRGKAFLDSFRVRINYFRVGIEVLKHFSPYRHLFGSGLNTFGNLYPLYKPPLLEETQMVHNNYLQLWIECGLLGFGLFILLWTLFLVRGWALVKEECQREKSGKDLPACWQRSPVGREGYYRKAVILGSYTGIISFLIHSLMEFNLYIPGITMNVFLLMGVMMSGKAYLSADKVEGKKEEEKKRGLPPRQITAFLLIPLIAALLSTVVVREMLARKHAERGKSLAEKGQYSSALTEFKLASQLDSLHDAYHFSLAEIYLRLGTTAEKRAIILDMAIAEYKKAIQLAPYMFRYHLNLARAYWRKSRGWKEKWIGKALQEYEKAIEYYPTRALSYVELGEIYQQLARNEEAIRAYKKAVELNPNFKGVEGIRRRIESLESKKRR